MDEAGVLAFLSAQGIAVSHHPHAAVFTVEESLRVVPPLPGAKTKNLFLRDKKGRVHVLVVVGHDKRVDLKALSAAVGLGNLSMASPERLMTHLGVTPGAVTVIGLVNDRAGAVRVVVDQEVWEAEAVQCHPLVNTATLVVRHEDLVRFLEATGHAPTVMDVPGTTEGP